MKGTKGLNMITVTIVSLLCSRVTASHYRSPVYGYKMTNYIYLWIREILKLDKLYGKPNKVSN